MRVSIRGVSCRNGVLIHGSPKDLPVEAEEEEEEEDDGELGPLMDKAIG